MAQRVKNLTAVAQVTAEAQVQSLAWGSGLKICVAKDVVQVTAAAQKLPYATGVAKTNKIKMSPFQVSVMFLKESQEFNNKSIGPLFHH